MKTVSYNPSKDELLVKFNHVRGKRTKELGRFKLWWDKEYNICALAIRPFTDELEEFRKHLNTIQLGGIWKSVEITDEDIKETRQDMLKKIEGKW